MMAQLMQLNTLMMQGLNNNNNTNVHGLNPFLPCPMSPSNLPNDIVYPASKPKNSVPPPPGFENVENCKTPPTTVSETNTDDDTSKERTVLRVSADESYKPTGIPSEKQLNIKR